MTNYIYALICPLSGLPRYVGKTKVPHQRLAKHISKARSGETAHHCAHWIRQLLAQDLHPSLQVIFTVPDGEAWQGHETRLITEYRAAGFDLTNLTSGGDGFPDLPPELRARMARKRAKTFAENPDIRRRISDAQKLIQADPAIKASKSRKQREKWADPNRRQLMVESMATPEAVRNRSDGSIRRFSDPSELALHSARMSEVMGSPEARAAQSIRSKEIHARPGMSERHRSAIRAAYDRPEVQAKVSACNAEIAQRPETKAKHSVSSRKHWAENHDAQIAAMWTDEARAKHRAAIMASHADPEVKAKRNAARWTPEARAKQAAEIASRRDAMRAHSPETITKRNASIKASWARRKAAKESQCPE